MEKVKVDLKVVWLCGFVLQLSFYATTLVLPSIEDEILMMPRNVNHGVYKSGGPNITIFTAPLRPFRDKYRNVQAVAVRSWLGLSSNINVVLFSQDPLVFSFAAAFGSRVSVESNIDFTFLGTPFFHSMVARAQASTSDVSVLLDPEILLLPEFITILNHVVRLDYDWLLIASSRNASDFPFHLDTDAKHWLSDKDKQIRIKKEFLAATSQLRNCEEKMILAWNNGEFPLHKGVLPPFLFRNGLHKRWIINEALSSDYRFVFDASLIISNFYHDDFQHGSYQSVEATSTPDFYRSWETSGNVHLAAQYGSLFFHEASYSSMVKLFRCDGQYLFVNTAEDIIYPFQSPKAISIRKGGGSRLARSQKIMKCVTVCKSQVKLKECSVKNQLNLSTLPSLPFSQESLLSERSDQNKTIVLAVAGYSYKDMLMSWVCRLRHLKISNFLVCALDQETYEFSVLQGLPVFKDSLAPSNISFDDCHFGTNCFQSVTKVKSRIVVQILKMGYNVLLTDVDIYWFKNPLPLVSSFGPAVLVAQSDEYNVKGPINLPRRLNSGFYYAHSDISTIKALEKVVKHAASSNLSEQPSFYDTLCGEGGSNRVGNDRCLEPETNLTVQFLNRDLFPNGAYGGLWEEKNVTASCLSKGCYILHNNWINGRRKKLERQVLSGLWDYDTSTRMCMQNWLKMKRTQGYVISEPLNFSSKACIHLLSVCVKAAERVSRPGINELQYKGNYKPGSFWLQEMLMRCVQLFWNNRDSRRRREVQRAIRTLELSRQLENISVRIVHAGGRQELYRSAFPASQLIEKYPGMCVAHPSIFRKPYESLVPAEEQLLPGKKYYIIPSTTVQKLKHRHSIKGKAEGNKEHKEPLPHRDDYSEEYIYTAKDFYLSKERPSRCLPNRSQKNKKPFVPPNQKPNALKKLRWKPRLTSIQELSS
uniref:Nucleotide-diphospho-sugar transferase domain-containing protein n=2 Tax=Daucus carota subsp. sativus TaxID=79200 RepID=A0A164TB74_DAUCS